MTRPPLKEMPIARESCEENNDDYVVLEKLSVSRQKERQECVSEKKGRGTSL